MLKVLVPLAIIELSENTIAPLHFTRETYIRKIVKYGLTPIFVSASMSDEMIDELYRMCHGALFTGGRDFDPKYYNQERHATTEVAEPKRDELELKLLDKILKDKKPYLGICRGCQGLNIASGGTLFQHIPEIFKEEFHGIGEGKTYDDLLLNERLDTFVEKDSKAFRLIKNEVIKVNSGHHQAVDRIGKDLRISAKSKSGVVEIIEHIDPEYFCFGIQSHPEADSDSNLEVFFKEFAKSVKFRM